MRKIADWPQCSNHPDRRAATARTGLCSSCWNKAHRAKNRDELRRRDRAKHFRTKYGLTPEQVDAQRAKQGGRCAICGVVQRTLHVDHSHETGELRGLLCFKCNSFLGLIEARKRLLPRLFAYLGVSLRNVIWPKGWL